MKKKNEKKKLSVKKKQWENHGDIKRYSIDEIQSRFTRLRNRLFLPSYLRQMKKLSIGSLTGGNKVSLIHNGDQCFEQFIKAMRSAKVSINLETFIFNSDEVGWEIARLLVKKSKKGVEVNVIYDAWGCRLTSPSIFSFLTENGVEVVEYHPFWPWRKYWNPFQRDHRKILVVDGKTAFVGGINIGKEYAGEKFNGEGWRDTHLRIDGPAVKYIQFYFIEIWYRNGGAILDQFRYFPAVRSTGKKLMIVLGSKTRKKIRPINESYLSAINCAGNSIFITNAYFVPTQNLNRALIHAARRGVDVRLMLPGKSDVPPVRYASRYKYKKYLKNGIRIYEYGKSILHAKTAVIDGIWSTVGSTNLDGLSFKKNLEINVVVLDQLFGEEMEKTFCNDIEASNELTFDQWEKRSFLNYILEWFWYHFRNFM